MTDVKVFISFDVLDAIRIIPSWLNQHYTKNVIDTGKSHRKKPDRISLNDDTGVEKVLRFKYATWNIRRLGEKEEELDKILN
jgi:hypothetical protein